MLCALIASIAVAFPAEGQKLPAGDCTYVIGAADTNRGARLYLNGVGVDVYRTGAFLAMARTRPGTNTLELAQGTNSLVRTFTVATPSNGASAPTGKRHDPYADLGIPAGTDFPPKPGRDARPGDVHVMVDAGHGGSETGALSPHGLEEKDFNIALAKSVESKLRQAGFKVTMTRNGDETVPLYDRPRRACREKADAFISIHHNATVASTDPRAARHVITYASNEKGLALARALQRHVSGAVAPVSDRGAAIKSLAVCRNPAVPSCLVEADFINLPEGEEASLDPDRRERIASAILLGLLDWLYE